jgi:hypothetical protein
MAASAALGQGAPRTVTGRTLNGVDHVPGIVPVPGPDRDWGQPFGVTGVSPSA